jgi:hypothetical protein
VASLQTHSAVQSLNQAREAKIAAGGTFRLTDFLLELVKLARQSIDTPEERTNVVNAVMGFYDIMSRLTCRNYSALKRASLS